MNYKISWLNNNLEITNPTIEIVGMDLGNPNISNINFITGTYSIDIHLIVSNSDGSIATFGLRLDNVQSESLNWESSGADVEQQVLDALNSQFSV